MTGFRTLPGFSFSLNSTANTSLTRSSLVSMFLGGELGLLGHLADPGRESPVGVGVPVNPCFLAQGHLADLRLRNIDL